MNTMAQRRAKFALNQVLEITKNKDEKAKKDFKSFSAGAPAMILQNGFGQTLAFWLAKGSDKHTALFRTVKRWLTEENKFLTKKGDADFMEELHSIDQSKYLVAQNEALALLEWIKRFANAELS